VGVAHAGWRGLIGGVLEALLGAMPCEPTELSVWLGPAIGPAAYQVGRDVYEAVLQLADGRALAAQVLREQAVGEGSTTSEVRYLFDLYQLARLLLLRQGVTEVLVSKACTASEPRFFSYRRDGVTGRMATVAWLPG